MANDSFLKDWLTEEEKATDEALHLKALQEYLIGIKLKYDYNSVFLISDKTNHYYHYEGVHKKVSPNDNHDRWYYDFVDENVAYELDIDSDEADFETLTVFVNCRIEDQKRGFMGVTGVGLEMDEVQNILLKFERDFDVEAFLIDETGLIQVHTSSHHIEETNVFNEASLDELKVDIIQNTSTMESNQYTKDGTKGYLITRYIDELDWYLVVRKDTSVLMRSFRSQIMRDMFILILVFSGVMLLTRGLVNRFKTRILNMAKTDQLTQLPNRRGFDEMLRDAIIQFEDEDEEFFVFVLDIDDFKDINDIHGHIFGDHVIKSIGHYAKKIIKKRGNIARWGGDEFAGIIFAKDMEAKIIAQEIIDKIHLEKDFKGYNISVSIGMTKVQKIDTSDTLLNRADKGLYIAKEKGKSQMMMVN